VKVLFVIDTWGLIGGTERYAGVIVPALVERGHELTILCREALAPGPEGVALTSVAALAGPGLGEGGEAEVSRILTSANPDVIFVAALRNIAALTLLLDAAPLVRFVQDHTLFCPGLNKYTESGETCRTPLGSICLERYWLRGGCTCFKRAMHDRPLVESVLSLREREREIELTRRASSILTNSTYMRSQLLQVGCDPGRTDVLYYFTRSATEDQPAGDLSLDTQAFLENTPGATIFTPARLTLPDKGVDHLLTALTKVDGEFKAVIAGSGPAEEWLRSKTEEDGLQGKVHFAGWTDSGAMEALYALASMVVCPSVWDEPFGLVGIEAMAHGKPVVAFDVGGIPEWLEDGVTGHLVPRRDTSGMARAIDALLSDPDQARSMGENGRTVLPARFGVERHVDGIEHALVRAAT